MEKFGMTFGGGPSRKELLETMESQKKQLLQYQSRFKDVVQAYKSLLKEKEALESSLKVLTATQDLDMNQQGHGSGGGVVSDLTDDGCSLHSEDSMDTAASVETPSDTTREDQSEDDQGGFTGRSSLTLLKSDSDGMGAELQQATPPPGTEVDRRVAQLKSQLSTLTGALATVTQEKSRMEANFQADKRQLKQEVEELQERLSAAAAQQEVELGAMQLQLAESRARVITQQHEREQEQEDHVQQLRELQRLLQQERDLRQDAELRLQDATATALLLSSQAVDRGAESEAHLSQLREERDELRRRLQATEVDQRKPDPRVEQLQQEVRDLKDHYQQQVHTETRKMSEAEERARERAQSAEVRVAGLEQRVSELSELLGSCEKARQRDQQTAQRLRDRLLQLDTENKTLAMAASSRAAADPGLDEAQLDVSALKEKLQKVKKLLQLAAQRNPDLNIQELNIQNLSIQEPEPDGDRAAALAVELRQLKDEFERYKLRAQVVLKNKNAKDGSQARELEEVRDQLSELREKYINLRIQSDEAEERHCHQLEERQQEVAMLQLAHRQEAERVEALHRDELLRLEAELHKHRERTMALLDDKDQELERLRAATLTYSTNMADSITEVVPDSDDAISQALRRATPTESTLLLYAEQLARKEVEVGGLRRQKNRLEEDLHQLQARLIANGERHDEEAAQLRGQIDKLVRDQRREGANMEYLKNVIYRFLTLQDASGRQQTLSAILTILHFSPQEKQDVLRLQATPWWR